MTTDKQSSWSERTFVKKRRRSRRLIAVASGFVIVGLAIIVSRQGDPEDVQPRLAAVRVARKPYEEILQQNGRLEAQDVRSVFTRVTGTITWKIAEGTHVHEGTTIVRFDDTEMRQKLEDYMEQSYKPGEFALESDTQTLENKKIELALEIKLAGLRLEIAHLGRKRLLERYADDLEIATLNMGIAAKDAAIAQLAVDVNGPLVKKGMVAANTLSTLTVDALNAKARHEEAVEKVRRLKLGPTPLELRAADNTIRVAEENLETARFNHDADIAIYEAEVAHARAQLERLEIWKRQNEEQIEKCEIKAPLPGVVVYVNVWKGGGDLSPINVGETRSRGSDLLKMADTTTLQVHMLLTEPDALKVHVGQKAKVRFVAFPDLVVPATVTYVSPDAFDKNIKLGPLALAKLGEAGVNVVEVRVTLDEKDPRIRLGLSAVAEITISNRDNVLVVPMSTIVDDDTGFHVWRKSGSGFSKTAVKVSDYNEMEAVVSEGLMEGEELLDAPLVHGYH